MSFGQFIAFNRKRQKLSQNELCNRASLPYGTYVKYEKDEARLHVDTAIKIADALGVSLDMLVGRKKPAIEAELLKKFELISRLPVSDKERIFLLIDAFIGSCRAR